MLTIFKNNSYFNTTKFYGIVEFDSADFKENVIAQFLGAQFHRAAYFLYVKFNEVNFNKANFFKLLTCINCNFHDRPTFKETTFSDDVDFNHLNFNGTVDCYCWMIIKKNIIFFFFLPS
jgi:uncharacterized protein YjbI with pentapeptide repeats